jgi:hypothetical protein
MSELLVVILIIVAIFVLRKHIEGRAASAVSALAAALKVEPHFSGPGNMVATRLVSNAQQMLKGAQDKLDKRDWVAAEEAARLGQDFLKLAYLRAPSQ